MDYIQSTRDMLRSFTKWSRRMVLFMTLIILFVVFNTGEQVYTALTSTISNFSYIALGANLTNLFFLGFVWLDSFIGWRLEVSELAHFEKLANESNLKEIEALYQKQICEIHNIKKKLNPIHISKENS